MNDLRNDADIIIKEAIQNVLPDSAVVRALQEMDIKCPRIHVVAVGKAAWQMAAAASKYLGSRICRGIVITKYGHVKGDIPDMTCFEAGHPVPDANSFAATGEVLRMVRPLGASDAVLFLLSGGGSALFEKPLIPADELETITHQLLASGADIVEMNTIRKRLSGVKGGRFAMMCAPAPVYSIVLSDILGDPLDMIASGPACPDSSTCEQAQAIVEKYGLRLSAQAWECLKKETPHRLEHVYTQITGSVRQLCRAAADACRALGYTPLLLTDHLDCEAREAGAFLAAIARTHQEDAQRLAFIAGGETVVHVTGKGKGGRNQELTLSAARGISGIKRAAIFSVGSDGTDGPTDAAGGYCDGETEETLNALGIDIYETLQNNDAYTALDMCGGLIRTGPTGTNVNDVAVVLLR